MANPRNPLKFLAMMGIALLVLLGVMVVSATMQYRSMKRAVPAIDATGQFIMLVGSGNVQAAKGLTTDAIDESRLTDTVEQIESFGPLRDVDKYFGGKVHSRDDIEVQALMRFDAVSKVMVAHWTMEGDVPRLREYQIEDAPATATTQESR